MTEKKTSINIDITQFKATIIAALQDKKAKDITELDLSVLGTTLFDSFIICTATSNIHAQALCDNVLLNVKQSLKILPKSTEGIGNAQWILIDYFDIVVHIFLSEYRTFYDIESLWKDAKITHYE
ncbi:MAG: ribosome silencing factor [Bacteroidales bacterium]|jgi:ribosome-associated protein|nr:ribosome silencing factor [Bacteroidales bacterium]